jgi:hypothetical protein
MDKPDCVACTEVKQHVKSFPKSTSRHTDPGELTHIDLWGKYAVKSIHSNQYYLLFINDVKRYAMATCLKEKTDAAQGVINYFQHLITQERNPKVIQMDGGKEFINDTLKQWCRERSIEIHIMAPYSPSQNGVAECMNQTLMELSHTMLRAQDIPEFLWEYALLHMWYMSGIGHSLPIWEMSPPSKDGSNTSQMCPTFESSVHLFGSFYKAKRKTEKCYQSPNDMYMLALMMALRQLSNTVPKCIKY